MTMATIIRAGQRLLAKNGKNSFSTGSKVSHGVDVISPTIGLTSDQAEFYSLARRFADEAMRPFAGE